MKKGSQTLLQQYLNEYDKPLKPINLRGKHPVHSDVYFHCCNASHKYIYNNTGGRGQFLCKVCDTHHFLFHSDIYTISYKRCFTCSTIQKHVGFILNIIYIPIITYINCF